MEEFLTLFLAATPIIELRGALPIALTVFNFSLSKAIILSVLGNILPVLPIILFLAHVENWLNLHFPPVHRFLLWFSKRSRNLHGKKFENWGAITLFFLTAIPLPLTGAWTAALGAYLFKIPIYKAFPAIVLGVVAAAFLVSIFTLGVGNLF